ncbi:helix-turn-helix transcriptional regulator [Lysinibacillus sp. KU-BSD001]|uniref:helix-turn-helix domain-containing protein n=1 Tax=Lysinibacillus sp. KU-BSD001 TaxID=3141328 RepID=UPI0036E598D9
MNLQKLLVSLRGEESIPTAAKRMGLSIEYYRSIERGYCKRRGNIINPSPTTLKKIAKAYKVDYMVLVEAAGYENDIKYNPERTVIPFREYPVIQKWYESLPSENIDDIKRLHAMWQLLKGCDIDVLRTD